MQIALLYYLYGADTTKDTSYHVCVWVYVCGCVCVYVCGTIHTPVLPSAPASAPTAPGLNHKQSFSLYGHGHCLIPRTVPPMLPLLKPKHTVCYGRKKTVQEVQGEERKAFPETHLVLMQGPLV